MTVKYFNILRTGRRLGGYAWRHGTSQFENQFQTATYSAKKNGLSIDGLVQTTELGEFEIKILGITKGNYDLDEINYVPNGKRVHKMNLYKNSGTPAPPPFASPLTYKITTKNNNTDLQVFFKYAIVKGSAKVRIGPNKSGIYEIKRVSIYDYAGRTWLSFIPPKRKSKTAKPISVVVSPAVSSSGNPSP